MPRLSIVSLLLVQAMATRLVGQQRFLERLYLDSATTAKANAQCGSFADESVFVDSMWVPGPQTLVSINAYGLEGLESRYSPPPEYRAT